METTEVFRKELLGSGVWVVGQPMEGVESAALGILIGTGARDEDETRAGISHFIDQMLFRGTENRNDRQLSEEFDSLGIAYDASAALEFSLATGVMLGDKIPAALELFSEVLSRPSFPEDALESVKLLLVQELRQREDQPPQKVMDILRQRFFAGSALSHDVLGREESINRITREDLVAYWRDRYTANNMVVSLAGNFDWDACIEQLDRLTRSWRTGRGRMLLPEPKPQSGRYVMQQEMAQENIGFAFPGVAIGAPHYYGASLFAQILGGSSNSRLFQEVREKRGLAYSVQARFDGLEKTGLYRIYVGTTPERADESVRVILDELAKVEREGVTQDELDLAKTRVKSYLIMRSESTSARMVSNVRNWWFEQKLYDLQEVRDRIDSVSVEEIAEIVKSIGLTERLAAVALGPRSEEELFASVLAHR